MALLWQRFMTTYTVDVLIFILGLTFGANLHNNTNKVMDLLIINFLIIRSVIIDDENILLDLIILGVRGRGTGVRAGSGSDF